jgi:endonuclease YncB( thermonuclease family)
MSLAHAASTIPWKGIPHKGIPSWQSRSNPVGDVILPDGMNLNQELVKQGWCWWYQKYAPGDTVLEGLEKDAREGKKGLWADPQPVPPWEWRKK